MRIAILVSAMAALAAAFPYPQDQENPDGPDDEPSDDPETSAVSFATRTVPVQLSTSLNIPITGSVALPTLVPGYDTTSTSRRNPHWEPIPIFTKACTCDVATVRYPCWATDSLQRCHYEENFSYGCYMVAAGGCPTPTRVCSNLFQPTPRTGRHPCDLGGNPPLITSTLSLNVSLPVPTSVNVTAMPVPSVNVTLPVSLPL